jgi:hypothetical protein
MSFVLRLLIVSFLSSSLVQFAFTQKALAKCGPEGASEGEFLVRFVDRQGTSNGNLKAQSLALNSIFTLLISAATPET